MADARDLIRLDKWLWHARFFKTRTLCAKVVSAGHVRVNSVRVAKASVLVGAGDTLTFAQGHQIKVIEIIGLADKRGPAIEAQKLYHDRSPAPDPTAPPARAARKGGRPTKKDRRAIDRLGDNQN